MRVRESGPFFFVKFRHVNDIPLHARDYWAVTNLNCTYVAKRTKRSPAPSLWFAVADVTSDVGCLQSASSRYRRWGSCQGNRTRPASFATVAGCEPLPTLRIRLLGQRSVCDRARRRRSCVRVCAPWPWWHGCSPVTSGFGGSLRTNT